MDPRVFFRKQPSSASPAASGASNASSPPSPADAESSSLPSPAGCRYSSFYSSRCLNGECETVKQQFRQCDNRPREELVTAADGHQHWEPASQQDAASLPSPAGGLSFDVGFPDPLVSLFDEVREQTQLMASSFRGMEWGDDRRRKESPVMRKGRDDGGEKGTACGGDGSAGRAGGEEGRKGDGAAGGVLDGVVDILHTGRELMDQLWRLSDQRPSPHADTGKRDTSGADLEDED